MPSIPDLLPLFRQLNDLKRLRVAAKSDSIAEGLFGRSWSRLVAGESLENVALSETADAVVAARLAGINAQILADGGIQAGARLEILERAFDSVAEALPTQFAMRLKSHCRPKSRPLQL